MCERTALLDPGWSATTVSVIPRSSRTTQIKSAKSNEKGIKEIGSRIRNDEK